MSICLEFFLFFVYDFTYTYFKQNFPDGDFTLENEQDDPELFLNCLGYYAEKRGSLAKVTPTHVRQVLAMAVHIGYLHLVYDQPSNDADFTFYYCPTDKLADLWRRNRNKKSGEQSQLLQNYLDLNNPKPGFDETLSKLEVQLLLNQQEEDRWSRDTLYRQEVFVCGSDTEIDFFSDEEVSSIHRHKLGRY